MEPCERDWVRLPLRGAVNVRELGGYPTFGGGQTRYHRFLRSDALNRLTASDVRFLRGYGVSCVIDLRDEREARRAPDVSLGEGVLVENIPLLGVNLADEREVRRRFGDRDLTMLDLYELTVDNLAGVRACMETIAVAPQGCVLFHCALGKDRTGVLAAILLGLAGVDRWDVVSNYMQSRAHMMRDEVYAADWLDPRKEYFRDSLDSAPETATFILDCIEGHGGAEAYLRACGVSDTCAEAVRARLTGD